MSFRIGATVLVNNNCIAIQSYNFKERRILGNLKQVLKFLDAYGVDELHVVVPSKGKVKYSSTNVFYYLSNITI